MYLSRLILNGRSREARRDLANCHDLHRTVLRAFPDLPADPAATGEARARLGVLFRLESDGRTGAARVLVQSRERPDWSRLPAGYMLETGGLPPNPDCKEITEAYAAIRAGDELVFRLRANPTKRLPRWPGQTGYAETASGWNCAPRRRCLNGCVRRGRAMRGRAGQARASSW